MFKISYICASWKAFLLRQKLMRTEPAFRRLAEQEKANRKAHRSNKNVRAAREALMLFHLRGE